ncbi:peroxisomal membrane protein PEX14-like [Homarus americanus]|uniref:peroxisomal membrane protein PEX14-like n=1 Tax=Homarus americanus TaxID=6706 RepID=UPI001C44C1EB|nr:peroxisomal membrane protein PEX14-like [Homarus americanus]
MSVDTMEETTALRQKLVDEAAKFLLNPSVINHASDQKTAFLHKKGLTETEIEAAFAKAKTVAPMGAAVSSMMVPHPGSYSGPPASAYMLPSHPSVWIKIRDICNFVLILTGASYGIYHIYQKYLGPWLTGRRQKTVDESMTELQQSVVTVLKEIQTTLASLDHTISAQNVHIQALSTRGDNQGYVTPKQLDQLKGEITSLKGLLINRRTFPSTPSMAPSIPSWQRSKAVEKPLETTTVTSVTLSNQVEVIETEETSLQSTKLQEDLSEMDIEAVIITSEAAYADKEVLKGEIVAVDPEENGHDKDELSVGDSGSFPDSSDEMSQ